MKRQITFLVSIVLFCSVPYAQQQTDSRDSIRPVMVLVQGGWFNMGSKKSYNDEKPVHRVWVDDFYIGKYEVTQKEWEAVMNNNPSRFKGENNPVENISWDEAQRFIRVLNMKTGLKYRLPTEAEWEYAARGGNSSRGYKYSGSNKIDEVAWYTDNSGWISHPVGQKKPNELGLYDMSGNVEECCEDWYSENYYQISPQRNPKGSSDGRFRVFRGGSWIHNDNKCTTTFRGTGYCDSKYVFTGLRLALDK